MPYVVLPLALLGITLIEALGLQLIVGQAGLLTFGHAAFFAIGAYTSAAWVVYALPWLGISHFPVLALMTGACAAFVSAFVLALLVGGPCLRLRGDYLAAATLGLSQLTENVLFNSAALGGASGFANVPMLVGLPGIWFTAACVLLFRWRWDRTPLGHAIVCARDDDIVAQSFGISSWHVRWIAFGVGSALAGLAGALYVHMFAFVGPSAAGLVRSVSVLLAVVVGGPYTRQGACTGAALLVLVPEALRFVPPYVSAWTQCAWTKPWLSPRLAEALVGLSGNAMCLFAAMVLWALRRRARSSVASLGSAW